MPKVSVIIPVYNAANFIEKCCRSLFEQSLKDMEFVFVNDGSEDDSVDLINNTLECFPDRISQCKVIDRSENYGVAYTRQQGVDNASGEYLIHCDADDWVEPNMYELLLKEAEAAAADIVCCNYYIDRINGASEISSFPKDEYKISFNISPISGSLVNKLIKRDLIEKNKITFHEGINWGEDFMFSIKCQLVADKVCLVHKALYHYIQQGNSITHTVSKVKYLELVKCGTIIERFLEERELLNTYIFELNYLKFQLKQRFLRSKELRDIKFWLSIYPECHNSILKYPVARYLKLSAWFACHNLSLLSLMLLKFYDFYNTLR